MRKRVSPSCLRTGTVGQIGKKSLYDSTENFAIKNKRETPRTPILSLFFMSKLASKGIAIVSLPQDVSAY